MKITSATIFSNKIYKNLRKDNNTNSNSALNTNISGLYCYKVNFQGKIPSIVTPTMEDLINRTKAIDVLRYNILRLAQYNVPCPVCGKDMLYIEYFNKFEQNIMQSNTTKEILDCIQPLIHYAHNVESGMFNLFKDDLRLHPNRTLLEMLKVRLPKAEKKIIQSQTKIFTDIGLLSRKLPQEERTQVQELLNETFARILDPRETSRFSRRIFIYKLKYSLIPKSKMQKLKDYYTKEFLSEYKDTEYNNKTNLTKYVDNKIKTYIARRNLSAAERKIVNKAEKLPTAHNNSDAFIVKYAKRNYGGANPDKKIAIRLLSNSLATVEHIKAQSKKGDTAPYNLALECASCNNGKGNMPIIEQIIENPQMLINYPRYIARLCQIHKMGKVEKSYITQQNKTYAKESFGLLNEELTELRYTGKKKHGYKPDSGKTPTKSERREARKLKLKNKKIKLKKDKI